MEFVEIIKIIWTDMVNTPVGALLGVVIIFLFLFKDQVKEFLNFKLTKSKDKFGKTDYDRGDVLEHPIFRDLDYWINKGISIVKIEKSYAKELIMKDLLRIKFNCIKDVLSKKVKDDSIKDMKSVELKKFIQDSLREMSDAQLIGWRNAGIPEVFIKKYMTIQYMGQEVLQDTIKVFLSDSLIASNYTKLYLIMSVLDSKLTSVFANAVSTALSLNGDLNGTIYKGVVIGKSKIYAVDTPVAKDIIESRLFLLLSKMRASRASVILFHDYPGTEPFDGKFSIVYEVSAPGVSIYKDAVQYMPAYLLTAFKQHFDKDELVMGGILDFDYGIDKLMEESGTEALIAYPIKDANKNLKGFISLNWLSKTKYESCIKGKDVLSELKTCSEDIKQLLLGYK